MLEQQGRNILPHDVASADGKRIGDDDVEPGTRRQARLDPGAGSVAIIQVCAETRVVDVGRKMEIERGPGTDVRLHEAQGNGEIEGQGRIDEGLEIGPVGLGARRVARFDEGSPGRGACGDCPAAGSVIDIAQPQHIRAQGEPGADGEGDGAAVQHVVHLEIGHRVGQVGADAHEAYARVSVPALRLGRNRACENRERENREFHSFFPNHEAPPDSAISSCNYRCDFIPAGAQEQLDIRGAPEFRASGIRKRAP